MFTLNEKYIMINHVLDRREKHLAKLISEDSPPSTIRLWNNFYKKLLQKYDCNEVLNYGS